ncbi:MAG: glycosyltransferase family 39 protein, partial [Kiloniellales bacterium]|nr:glycosyltransferase family 39 protein [Kiloniellales bacterium]
MSVVDRDIAVPAGAAGLGRATPLALMERSLAAVIVLVFALALLRAFVANVNWDEFYYLSHVHAYRNGTLAFPLQTFSVHFFAWLPLVSENEVEQIVAARVALWLLSVPAAILIYKIARSFCSRPAALLSVLFYFGFSNVVDHGLSFRADPLCAYFFLASLYCLVRAEGSRISVPLSAVFMAIAMMISIKSVFYLGTIGTIFLAWWLFEPDRRATVRKAMVFALAFAGAGLVLYHLHAAALASAATTEPAAFVKAVGNKTLVSVDVFPRLNTLLRALVENGPIWIFVMLGLAAAGCRLVEGPERKAALVLLAFAVPLLSLP